MQIMKLTGLAVTDDGAAHKISFALNLDNIAAFCPATCGDTEGTLITFKHDICLQMPVMQPGMDHLRVFHFIFVAADYVDMARHIRAREVSGYFQPMREKPEQTS